METEAPEAELEDEAAALPPASSSSAASPLRPPEETKPRQEELAGPKRRPRWSSPRTRVMTASGAHLEHEAPGRQRAVKVGPYSDFTAFDARPLSSSAAPLRQPPKETTPGSSRSPTRTTGSPVPHGAAADAESAPSSRRLLASSSLSLPSSSLSLEEEPSLSEE